MLIDYPMIYPADIVPSGARTPRRVRAEGSHVVEIRDVAGRDAPVAMRATVPPGGTTTYSASTAGMTGEQMRDAVMARLESEEARRLEWFMHDGRLMKDSGLEGSEFEEKVIEKGGIRPPGPSVEDVYRGGREGAREWIWDGRLEQMEAENRQAAARICRDGLIATRQSGPVWQVFPHFYGSHVSLVLHPSIHLAALASASTDMSTYFSHENLADAWDTGRAVARKRGGTLVEEARFEASRGVFAPGLDIEAIGVLIGVNAAMRSIVSYAPAMPTHLLREYCDLRDRVDAVGRLQEIDMLGTASEFRRSPELEEVSRHALHMASAVGGSRDLVAAARTLRQANERLFRSRPPATEPENGPAIRLFPTR